MSVKHTPIIAAAVLLAAGCAVRRPMPQDAAGQVDAFRIACATATNCTNNTPAKTFVSSVPVSGGVLVTRNGVVMYGGPQNFDYSATVDAAGRVSVTFTAQPVVDGDLILMRYAAAQR